MDREKVKKIIFIILLALSATPFVTAPVSLLAGIVFGLTAGNPWRRQSSTWSKWLLQVSVVGLGFGLGIGQIWTTGRQAVFYTVIGIAATILTGKLIGMLFKINPNISTLISFGTAICGGSAIAAMAPVIKSNDDETAVSLATVFSLNSIALFLFPYLGHIFHLSQKQFGLWAALSIHDTSSVIGAAAVYGGTSLAIATTVKLARAVWIAPIALGAGWLKKSGGRVKLPVFILGFIAAAVLRSLLPQVAPVWNGIAAVARQSLVVTLFLIGSGLTGGVLKNIGVRPLFQALTLWLLVSLVSLFAVINAWI